DAAGASAGYGVPAVAGAVALTVGFLGFRRLERPAAGRGGIVEQHSGRERQERHLA
ncbi:MFS transporter, partial [Streptomyces sp. TRM76130]|nr:MFS transporter [Streptomyces sp. TRM76130]